MWKTDIFDAIYKKNTNVCICFTIIKKQMFCNISFDYINDKGNGNDRKAATSTDLQLKPTSVFP